jgi:hypothetical protein
LIESNGISNKLKGGRVMAGKIVSFYVKVEVTGNQQGVRGVQHFLQVALDAIKAMNTEGYLIADTYFKKSERIL